MEVRIPLILPVFDLLSDIGSGIYKVLLQAIWGLLTGLMTIIDSLQDAFFFITGVKRIPLNIDGNAIEVTLLELLFGISNNGTEYDFSMPLHRVFISMLGVFAVIFVFFLICSIVKIQINREARENLPSMRKMLWKSACAFGVVLLLPVIFCLLLSFAGIFMEQLIAILKFDLLGGNSELSISECLFKASINGDVLNTLPVTIKPTWIADKATMTPISFEFLEETYGEGGVSFVLLAISVACVLVGLGMSVLTVGERLINIALLYVVAPVVIASIPLDDGKRWESWKDTTTVKILTAAANVISIYIFIYIMLEFGNVILSGQGNPVFSIVYMVIAVSGAFGCAKASMLLASLISANAGQQEGMGFMGNQAMLRMAGGVLKAGIGAVGFVLGANNNKNKKQSGNNSGGGGDDGGGSSETAHSKDDQALATSYNENLDRRQNTTRQNANGGANSGGSEGGPGTKPTIGGTMGKIMKAPLAVAGALGKAKSAVGKVLGTVGSYLNVPGALKLAGGALALPVAGVTGLVMGGSRLLNKIKGKKSEGENSSSEVTESPSAKDNPSGQTSTAGTGGTTTGGEQPTLTPPPGKDTSDTTSSTTTGQTGEKKLGKPTQPSGDNPTQPTESQTPKQERGRPSGLGKKTGGDETPPTQPTEGQTPKRGPGRPKGSGKKSGGDAPSPTQPTESQTPKRGPGRPKGSGKKSGGDETLTPKNIKVSGTQNVNKPTSSGSGTTNKPKKDATQKTEQLKKKLAQKKGSEE